MRLPVIARRNDEAIQKNNAVIPAKAGIPQNKSVEQEIAGQARNDVRENIQLFSYSVIQLLPTPKFAVFLRFKAFSRFCEGNH